MELEEKLQLVTKPPTEEVVTEQELRSLLERNPHPSHYLGLEVSGVLHLGSLVVNGFKVNDFVRAGMRCTIFLADWHSYINNKWGGDWETIKRVGREYYADAFRFFCPGVEIRYGSELYESTPDYWENVVRFSKQISLERDVRCLTIMGRSIKEKLDVAQYLYPPMQATDVHAMDLDLVHAGMDQRKVHILAREVFPSLRWKKPVAVHHHILAGLQEPKSLGIDEDSAMDRVISSKMSKSKPDTAIFIHDSEQEISRKIGKAWCPERIVAANPILDFAKYIVFHERSAFTIERPERFGGDTTYGSYRELESEYAAGKVHPTDLKKSVARELAAVLEPVRSHFEGKEIVSEILAS